VYMRGKLVLCLLSSCALLLLKTSHHIHTCFHGITCASYTSSIWHWIFTSVRASRTWHWTTFSAGLQCWNWF
jgi:hypothetical protein